MIQLLLIGILFTIIGLCALIFRKRKKFVGLIPLLLGLSAIIVTTVGPLFKSQDQINKVLKLDKSEIVKVTIKPTEKKGYEDLHLTQKNIELTDRNVIDSLCFLLNKSKIINSFVQSPEWVCLVRFDNTDETFFEVEVKGVGTVTVVEVKSNGDYGWVYGTLKAKLFGDYLTEITR